jgi:DNA end-binding protein Ku
LQGDDETPSVVGVVRWTMRNQTYNGALRLYQGYPMLMTLRNAQEVVPVESLEPPSGKQLDKKELSMARQLIGMLEAPFEPDQYRDEYRDRVLELIETKQEGGTIEPAPRRQKAAPNELREALEASLQRLRRSA